MVQARRRGSGASALWLSTWLLVVAYMHTCSAVTPAFERKLRVPPAQVQVTSDWQRVPLSAPVFDDGVLRIRPGPMSGGMAFVSEGTTRLASGKICPGDHNCRPSPRRVVNVDNKNHIAEGNPDTLKRLPDALALGENPEAVQKMFYKADVIAPKDDLNELDDPEMDEATHETEAERHEEEMEFEGKKKPKNGALAEDTANNGEGDGKEVDGTDTVTEQVEQKQDEEEELTGGDNKGDVATGTRDDIKYPPRDQLEKQCLEFVNEYRESKNKKPMTYNSKIADVARVHSKRMAEKKVEVGHDGFNQRVEDYPYVAARAAENVYAATAGILLHKNPTKVAMEAWIKSPTHEVNLVGDYAHVGCGVAEEDGTLYYTQLFGTPK